MSQPGQEWTEPAAEFAAAVEGERPGRQAVEGVVAVEDAGPLRGGPGEFDRALDRLCARVGEEDPLDSRVRAGHELLGQDAGQERAVHLHEVREVGVEGVVQRLHDRRMPRPEGEDAEPGQEVEVPVPFVVDEVATLTLVVEAVELEGAQHPGQLGIDVLGVESEVLALAFVQHLIQIKGHAQWAPGVALEGLRQVSGGTGASMARRSAARRVPIRAKILWRRSARLARDRKGQRE